MTRGSIEADQSELWKGYDLREFDLIVRDFVVFAFRSRPACLVELGGWYHESLRKMPVKADVIKLKRKGHILGVIRKMRWTGLVLDFVPNCTVELLQDVAADSNFDMGLLWLTSINPDQQEDAIRLLEAVSGSDIFRKVPETPTELLVKTGDGTIVMWLNPPLAQRTIVQELSTIASSFGWDVDLRAIEPT